MSWLGWLWLVAIVVLIQSPLVGAILLVFVLLLTAWSHYAPGLEAWKQNQESQAEERAQAKLKAEIDGLLAARKAVHEAMMATIEAKPRNQEDVAGNAHFDAEMARLGAERERLDAELVRVGVIKPEDLEWKPEQINALMEALKAALAKQAAEQNKPSDPKPS